MVDEVNGLRGSSNAAQRSDAAISSGYGHSTKAVARPGPVRPAPSGVIKTLSQEAPPSFGPPRPSGRGGPPSPNWGGYAGVTDAHNEDPPPQRLSGQPESPLPFGAILTRIPGPAD